MSAKKRLYNNELTVTSNTLCRILWRSDLSHLNCTVASIQSSRSDNSSGDHKSHKSIDQVVCATNAGQFGED